MSMNSRSQTTVEGLDDLIKAFMSLPEEAVVFVKEASNSAGLGVLEKARSKAPIDKGLLKKNLKLKKAGKSKKNPYKISSSVSYSVAASHATRVELGHKLVRNGNVIGTVKEQPFMRPAADESKEDVLSAIAGAMNKALSEMGGLK